MEDKVLKRAMFMMPLKSGTMNSGIMQGFEDSEEDDMDEEMSSAELTRRTPQSPEILMNNLRGDIRSVDARYEELAQMVGDQAAMDTPPEVLALLQGQMSQQQPPQGGIGALPQAPQPPMDQAAASGGIAGMMPQEAAPPMPAPQEQMAMPQGPMPTDQGMMPPPQGFADGGYVQHFADGSGPEGVTSRPSLFSYEQLMAMPGYDPTMPSDAAQIFNEPGLETVSPESYFIGGFGAGRLGMKALSGLRSRYFTPTPRDPNVSALLQSTGSARGARGMLEDLASGARAAPRKVADLARRNPAKSVAAGVLGTGLITSQMVDENAPAVLPRSDVTPTASTMEPSPAAEIAAPEDIVQGPRTTDLAGGAEGEVAAEPAMSGMERTKKYASDYERLFSDYLGAGTGEAQKTQALLLLADAGLKLASTSKPGESFASAVARSFGEVPAGLSQLASQQLDRQTSIKMASIQAAMDKVQSEDKAVRDLQIQQLKNQSELFKYMLGRGEFTSVEDLGAGLTRGVTKGGQVKLSQDPATVASAQNNPFTLNPETNPYVSVDTSYKPRTVTDKQTRTDLQNNLSEVESLLENIARTGPLMADAYGVPSAAVNMYNNVLVPLGASPNIRNAEAIRTVRQTLNQARPVLARIGGRTGRLAVQQEQWVDEVLGDKPGSWFSSPTIAYKNLQILNTDLLNYRARVMGELGLDPRVVRAQTPGLGIAEDPLIVPSDPKKQLAFANMISKQFTSSPNAELFIQWPSGEKAPVRVTDIINTFSTPAQ
ncbi:MAG: hypothetical protein EBT15_08325 [Betaproteobacteria bacterium]|nr:hypothetical protein [Betaproteobacteria bacterium]